jgi:hypothetical protein
MPENWDRFKKSDAPEELRLRRADPEHPLDFFYGKDFQGNYVFTFRCRITGDVPQQPQQLAGIDIRLYSWGEGELELQLRLLDAAQADIFKALCENLMSATRRLGREQQRAGIDTIIHRLLRWQELLKARKEKILTRSQVLGLWGELLVFTDMFLKNLSPLEALSSWRGPFGDEQDFIFANLLTEVKTQLSSSDRKIQISSSEQLDTVSGIIVICYQIVSPVANTDPNAMSLNCLIDKVVKIINAEGSALDILQSILIEFGYMHRSEYDEEKWILNERRFYLVGEGFPAIKASELPSGINDVRYSIKTDAISGYVMTEAQYTALSFSQDDRGSRPL